MINRLHHSTRRLTISLLAVVFLGLVAVPAAQAATLTVLVDTPTSFRATFTGVDTDASSIVGNDFFGCGISFDPCQFKYWSVKMNLRSDSVDVDGNANGFYEIQLIHTGTELPDPGAPLVKTFLVYFGLPPATVLTDTPFASGAHEKGSELLSTSTDLLYDPDTNSVSFVGSIEGDSDLDGDGIADADQSGANDDLVHVLNGIKNDGGMTGQQHGEVISDSRPKPGQKKKSKG